MQLSVELPYRESILICAGSLETISGAPRYSVILPVTQMRFPLYSFSGKPNLLRSLPQIRIVKIGFG